MKRTTRFLCWILVLALVLALAACSTGAPASQTAAANPTAAAKTDGGNAATPAPTEQVTAEADRYAEPMTISVYSVIHASSSLEKYPKDVWSINDKIYMDKFNVSFDYRRVPNANADENYNIMLASRDVTDVVNREMKSDITKYREAWLILDDFIKGNPDYPKLNERFYDNEYLNSLICNDDGKLFMLCTNYEQTMGDTFMVRGDLVQQWGINMDDVVTKEDFHDLFVQVKELSGGTIVPYMTRMQRKGLTQRLAEGWSGMKEDWYVDQDEMVVKFGVLEPEFRNVIEWLRQLYMEDLIDKEYPTTDTSIWQETALSNDGGIFLTHDNAGSRLAWFINQWAQLGVDTKWYEAIRPIQPGEGDPGHGTTTIHYPYITTCYAIYNAVDDKKAERILDMFEFANTDEGLQINWGIEGYNYYYDEEGFRQTLPEWTERDNSPEGIPYDEGFSCFFSGATIIRENTLYQNKTTPPAGANVEGTRYLVREAAKMYEQDGYIFRNWLEAAKLTDDETDRVNRLYADIDTYVNENLDRFIMGVTPMDQWDSFVEQLKKMNIQECMDIYNAALARSLN